MLEELARLRSHAMTFPRSGRGQVVSRIFRTFDWAERRPALAQAVTAPLICWSLSRSMFRYRLVDHAVPAMCRRLAVARLRADCPSGKAPTTRVRRRISRRIRSSGLLVRGSVQNLSHFRLAERRPALAHAVMASLICWSFSNSIFR
jgi:hypothetical protein